MGGLYPPNVSPPIVWYVASNFGKAFIDHLPLTLESYEMRSWMNLWHSSCRNIDGGVFGFALILSPYAAGLSGCPPPPPFPVCLDYGPLASYVLPIVPLVSFNN